MRKECKLSKDFFMYAICMSQDSKDYQSVLISVYQDFTGVPAVVDFAAMRDAVKDLGGDPERINPICPADLVIDHSVQVDFIRT